jgi:hypothetical protein
MYTHTHAQHAGIHTTQNGILLTHDMSKRCENLLHAATWVNFENIMPMLKADTIENYYMIPTI